MKRILSYGLILLFGAALLSVYASPAWAKSMGQSTTPGNKAWSTGYDPSGLIGAVALSPGLHELGRVVDVTDATDGSINFLIVSSCLPGESGRLVAVPYYSSHNFGGQVDSVEIPYSTKEFKDAPNYSRDSWSHEANWPQNAYLYFENVQ
jgi:hypothetical protein